MSATPYRLRALSNFFKHAQVLLQQASLEQVIFEQGFLEHRFFVQGFLQLGSRHGFLQLGKLHGFLQGLLPEQGMQDIFIKKTSLSIYQKNPGCASTEQSTVSESMSNSLRNRLFPDGRQVDRVGMWLYQ